jgi:competence protein ComGC
LKSAESVEILKTRLGLVPVRNTSLISITGYSESATECAALANAVAESFRDYNEGLVRASTDSSTPVAKPALINQAKLYQIQITDRAEPQHRPVRPNKTLIIVSGVAAGLFLGGAAFVIRLAWIYFRQRAGRSRDNQKKPDHFWRWFAVAVFAFISIPVVLAIIGSLAAIAIPNFVKARAMAQANARHAQMQLAHTNSIETWSPTLTAEEKPDLQKILSDAKSLMDQGHYEDALQRHLWYFNHALEYDQGQTGVRLSFALSQWVELGRHYPKAKQALLEIRDRDTQQLTSGQGYVNLFADVQAINRELSDEDATYALFKSIREKDPQLAGQCYFWVESLLVSKGEYQWCYDHMGDPQSRFDLARRSFDMERANQQRMGEIQQRIAQQIAAQNQKLGRTNPPGFLPPDTSAMLKKSAEDRFVGQVRQLIEILVATDHRADAEKIQGEAVTVLDDTRLHSAVTDTAEKVRNKLGQNGSESKLAAMTAVQNWLGLLEAANYAETWETAADSFHQATTKSDWVALLEKVRAPLGAVTSRKQISAQSTTVVPGMPAGAYFIAQFETGFAALSNAVETVTFGLEKDGQWKAIAYLIRPRNAGETAAVTAAQKWLAGIDAGDYAQSWLDASAHFQGAITQDNWVQALASVRKPMGKLEIRTVDSAVTETQLPGAPDGKYVVMQFATAFSGKNSATETVTFLLDADGTWKADGYYIK